MSKEPSEVMDLEDRDPKTLSQHLQVTWEDVIGEPNSIRSPECAWTHIWCITPCLRVWKISCAAARNFIIALTHAVIIPCTSGCGYFWSEIKVKTQAISGTTEEKKDDVLLI
ncbi:caveolin-3 [Asbolus verrucosus]|uniref:Caveolin n=1 Tax=Asbolus verrucosus TaxID=1661398 RepID=A0A482VV98_ASBVE|nr:caveolin-3 [Asbolus verrucosus]